MRTNDRDYLLNDQYKNAANLTARIDLHLAFSVNPHGWFRWVFDHFDLPPRARILEIACGRGDLWLRNLDRIPTGWEITLTDFARGMLIDTKAALADCGREYQFHLADIRSIPFEGGKFDALIANHMLYYVPDKAAAFREVIRVLKSGGRFFTTTIGEKHMADLTALMHRFAGPELSYDFDPRQFDFLLGNGTAQLQPYFRDVTLDRYPDALEITRVDPLVAYLLSGRLKEPLKDRVGDLRAFLSQEIQARGMITIFKDSSIFTGCKG